MRQFFANNEMNVFARFRSNRTQLVALVGILTRVAPFTPEGEGGGGSSPKEAEFRRFAGRVPLDKFRRVLVDRTSQNGSAEPAAARRSRRAWCCSGERTK
jgi:hypothetical protein